MSLPVPVLSNEDVVLFLGGLFINMVVIQAHRMAGNDCTDEEWSANREQFIGDAYDLSVARFADPLRSKLIAERSQYMASALRLN